LLQGSPIRRLESRRERFPSTSELQCFTAPRRFRKSGAKPVMKVPVIFAIDFGYIR